MFHLTNGTNDGPRLFLFGIKIEATVCTESSGRSIASVPKNPRSGVGASNRPCLSYQLTPLTLDVVPKQIGSRIQIYDTFISWHATLPHTNIIISKNGAAAHARTEI